MSSSRRGAGGVRVVFVAAIACVGVACGSDPAPVAPLTPTTAAEAAAPTDAAPTDDAPIDTVPTESTVAVTAIDSAASTLPTTEPVATAPPPTDTTAAPTTTQVIPSLDGLKVAVEPVAEIDQAIAMAVVPGGNGALWIAAQKGPIYRLDSATGESTVAADLDNLTNSGGEQGLLGLAVAPDGATLFVNYTDDDGTTTIDALPVGADGAIDLAGRRTVITIDQPHANHNGGDLAFGPDGYLYIGMGDGGSADDPDRRSLDLGDLLGKLLRIDPYPVDGFPYSVPPDNPFVGVEGARAEIWSTGLRNPWRFSFDRSTGDLWIGDVGQGEWEEIDLARAADGAGRGVSFGWSAFEGTHRFNDDQPAEGHTPPVWEYQHSDADGCSVTGGFVYRGSAIAGLTGAYVFGDYCSGKIWAAAPPIDGMIDQIVELGKVDDLASFGQDAAGELYVLSLSQGVSRLGGS